MTRLCVPVALAALWFGSAARCDAGDGDATSAIEALAPPVDKGYANPDEGAAAP